MGKESKVVFNKHHCKTYADGEHSMQSTCAYSAQVQIGVDRGTLMYLEVGEGRRNCEAAV
jgi:hypothetical protein